VNKLLNKPVVAAHIHYYSSIFTTSVLQQLIYIANILTSYNHNTSEHSPRTCQELSGSCKS